MAYVSAEGELGASPTGEGKNELAGTSFRTLAGVSSPTTPLERRAVSGPRRGPVFANLNDMLTRVIRPLLLGGLLAAVFPGPAHAQQAPQALSIRAAGEVGVDFMGVGIQASHPLGRWFGVDGTFAGGGVSDSFGLVAEVLGRAGYFGSRHALSLGLGPSFMRADHYGNVAFAQSEVAYEYRSPQGLSLLVGWGPALALTTSAANPCQKPSEDFTPGCGLFYREQFRPGQIGMRWRVGVGVAF